MMLSYFQLTENEKERAHQTALHDLIANADWPLDLCNSIAALASGHPGKSLRDLHAELYTLCETYYTGKAQFIAECAHYPDKDDPDTKVIVLGDLDCVAYEKDMIFDKQIRTQAERMVFGRGK